MNERSHLCRFLAEHPDWELRLAEDYGLFIKRNGPYAIFNYGRDHEPRFEEPLVQEARGIVLDVEALEVACWPFRKFGNYAERYVDDIDWSTARVQEKVDGSIVKLWYARHWKRWVFSTNGMIDAADAPIDGMPSRGTFLDAIRRADNYGDIPFDALDPDKTYIFELVGPEVRVVVAYAAPLLYHTGTRHNVTGQETDEDIGIVRPRSYSLHSLDDCIEAAKKLNEGRDEVTNEGFVVVDGAWHRVKVKSPDYLVRHKLSEIVLTMTNCLELLFVKRLDASDLCALRPRDAAVLKYYDWQLEELYRAADGMAELARAMYEEYGHDRGAVSRMIGAHPLANVGFRALNTREPGRALLRGLSMAKLCRLIRPYPETPLDAFGAK